MSLSVSLVHEVCHCQKITLQQMLSLCQEHEIQTLGQLQELSFAGTHCRNCLFEEADQSKLKKKIYCKDVLTLYKEQHG